MRQCTAERDKEKKLDVQSQIVITNLLSQVFTNLYHKSISQSQIFFLENLLSVDSFQKFNFSTSWFTEKSLNL